MQKKLSQLTLLYGEERDRVAKVAKAWLDAGVAERQVRLAENYATMLAQVLQRVFDDHDLALLPRRPRKQLPTVLRLHLYAVESSAADASGGLMPAPALPPAAEEVIEHRKRAVSVS